ncbi:MAG TPA: glycosyltransferase 87 family protein, partial [Candidatus Eisenbacteria bacterium]
MTHLERTLLFVGVASAALTAAAGFADGYLAGQLLVPWLAAHACYLLAVWLVAQRGARLRTWLLIAVGLLPRLLLLPAEPRLSEDIYRYLWDGRLVAEGVNPFPHAPADPALARYHDALLGHLNHADVPTIYPPMAQYLFGAAARLAVEPWAWKATLLALEALLLLALVSLLRARGLPPERLLLYFWNPLVIVESFGSGHVDLAAAAFLLFALALHEGKRPRLSGLAFAAAVLVKYMPLLLAPALLRRRAYGTLAVAAIAGAALFIPFVAAGPALWTGLSTYLRNWEFNGSLYALARPLFQTGEPPRLLLAALVAA